MHEVRPPVALGRALRPRPQLSWPALRLLAAVLAGAALWPAAAQAEASLDAIAMSLEELSAVRILATPKFAEDAEHSPSAVSIVTAAEIRSFGWRTLADVLRSLQGFSVTDDHTYAYVGVRGVSAPGDYRQRFQVLIDGMSVNENIYASTLVDSAFPLDLELVERIEVIRGPSASVYGGDSMFGVVNVVTRSLDGGEASLEAGSGRHRGGRVTHGGRTAGGLGYLVSASGFAADGQRLTFPDIAAGGYAGRASELRGETGGRLFARLRSNDWRATLVHSERDRVVPTGSYGTEFNDPAHRERDDYTLAEFAADQAADAHTTLHQRVYFGSYRYRGKFPYADPVYYLNRDDAEGRWWGFEGRLVSRAVAGQRWTVGLEYRDNLRQNQKNADLGNRCYDAGSVLQPAPCLDSRLSSRLVSVYAQDEVKLGQTLLTAGLRFDHRSQGGGQWSPRLGLVHETDRAGIFKLLYATAFRNPSAYERAYLTPTYEYGNPAVRSERMSSLEAGWEKRLGPGRLSVSAYLFRLYDMIAPEAGGTVRNSSPLTGRGLEAEYEQRWAERFSLRGGYTLQLPSGEGGRPDNAPRQMFKANLAAELGGGLHGGLEAQHVTRRLAAYGTQSVGAYTLLNLNLRYLPPGQRWDLSLGLYNLLDRRFSDPVAEDVTIVGPRWSLPQLGRTALIRAGLRF